MLESYKRLSFKHKNNKVKYYVINYFRILLPLGLYRRRRVTLLKKLSISDREYIQSRVDYYNRLNKHVSVSPEAVTLRKFKTNIKRKTHDLDAYKYLCFFPSDFRFNTCFGDVTFVPEVPSLVKSRPISEDNANSVILKLGFIRHFIFINKDKPFKEKQNRLVGRSNATQPHRVAFLQQYFNHPLCDIGDVSKRSRCPEFKNQRLTISEHLKYKFILCLEGNDVASNLKWVMSSNSIAVMPTPVYETWFQEGTLIPNYHYIQIKSDYSDLEERLLYYIEHTAEAEAIIQHAHDYVRPFKNQRMEHLISLLVLEKYFKQTGQSF
jgi:hypothetical protein